MENFVVFFLYMGKWIFFSENGIVERILKLYIPIQIGNNTKENLLKWEEKE